MGLLAALLSTIFSSSKDLMSKRLASRLDGTVSTFASFAFALPFYIVLLLALWWRGSETFVYSLAFWTLVLLRSLTDTFAEWMKMHALAHGDLSIIALILSMSPLLLLVASPLITGDRLSIPEVASVVLVVAGSVLMVYRPSGGKGDTPGPFSVSRWVRRQADVSGLTPKSRLPHVPNVKQRTALGVTQKRGILLAAGAACFFSLNSCFDRLAVERGTPVFSGFTMTLLSALFLCPFVVGRADRIGSLRTHFLGFLTRGLLETAFMVCKLFALQSMHAPALAGIQRLSLLLSILGGRVFFKEEDFKRRLAAGCLIVAGVVVIAWWQMHSQPLHDG